MILNQQLKSYTPYDDAESASVQSFLKFLDTFQEHVYTRDNILGHLCGSAWIVNKDRTKALMAYHNTYDDYHWLGGHADGQTNMFNVALREAGEESGLTHFKPLNNGKFIDVDTEFSIPQIKHGKAIASHLHFTLTYLFEADENEPLVVQPLENSSLKWFTPDEIIKNTNDHMKPIYTRIINKVKELNL